MMTLPAASRALSAAAVVQFVDADGQDTLAGLNARLFTTPLSVTDTLLVPDAIVVEMLLIERGVPVPPAVEYVATENVSLPIGALDVTVQTSGVPVQFVPGTKLTTVVGAGDCGFPFQSVNANATDWVVDETYIGRACAVLVVDDAGTTTRNVIEAVCHVPDVAGMLEPVPVWPHAARSEARAKAMLRYVSFIVVLCIQKSGCGEIESVAPVKSAQ